MEISKSRLEFACRYGAARLVFVHPITIGEFTFYGVEMQLDWNLRFIYSVDKNTISYEIPEEWKELVIRRVLDSEVEIAAV